MAEATDLDAAEIPDPPDGFSVEATETWRRLWAASSGWLHPSADFDLLRMICEALEEHEALVLVTSTEEGRWTRAESGRLFPHPAVEQLRRVEAQLTSWMASAGLTPQGRVNVPRRYNTTLSALRSGRSPYERTRKLPAEREPVRPVRDRIKAIDRGDAE